MKSSLKKYSYVIYFLILNIKKAIKNRIYTHITYIHIFLIVSYVTCIVFMHILKSALIINFFPQSYSYILCV